MREAYDNLELFDQKLLLLKKERELSTYIYHFEFFIHHIKINFFSRDNKSPLFLTAFSTSARDCTIELTVYWDCPSHTNLSEEEFCDDSSQDCFEQIEGVIQRDFIAKRLGKNTFYSCFPIGHTDGLFNFLRWLLPPYMLEQNEAIIHSSVVIDTTDRAIVFLGYSGAGKTTMTTLAGDRLVLGDDMNRLLFVNGKLYASAGSVGGAFEPSVSADTLFPVKSIYWLKQSSINEIKDISPAKAYQRLFASMIGWNWGVVDSTSQNKMMKFIENILQLAPIQELNFKKDNKVWKIIEESDDVEKS